MDVDVTAAGGGTATAIGAGSGSTCGATGAGRGSGGGTAGAERAPQAHPEALMPATHASRTAISRGIPI
ncbi:MAG TPA: hypothetical protein EYQ83_20460 [Acidobacteria bacterium]|nr:hypothetical protein [Acidobacteriota bacterium]